MMADIGLLILRLGFAGILVLSHGLPKLQKFSQYAGVFPDPLHVGSKFSLILAIFGELICGALVTAGLATRIACVPVVITMLVAFGVVHAADPWVKKEMALLYAIPFITLMLTGPGRLSLDALIGAKRQMGRYRP